LAFEYVKISIDNKTSFLNYIHAKCVSRLTIEKSSCYSISNFLISLFGCHPGLGCPGPAPRLPLPPSARHCSRRNHQWCTVSGFWSPIRPDIWILIYLDRIG